MPILSLDTSAAISVAVLGDDETVWGQALHDDQRQHAELLAPLIQTLLADVEINPAELTGVAVGTGPGPFTGLRIGLVTAETLAFALGIPIYGVCSLAALATSAAAQHSLPIGAEIVAALDARRKEIYWARYRVTAGGELTEIVAPQVSAPTVLAGWVAESTKPSDKMLVVGEGALKYGLDNAKAPIFATAEWVGRIAQKRAASGIAQPTQPLYLRRPDIQGQAPQAM